MSEGLFSGYIKLKEDINKDIVRQNEGIVRPEFSEVAVRCFLLLSEYLGRAAFAPTPKNKELMKLIDLDNSVIAERMGITESTVRAKKCVAAKEIARQLGDNVIDVIRSGNEFEIERLATKIRTLMLYRHPTDWLPEGIIEQYAGVYNGKAYDIKTECKDELRYLAAMDVNLQTNVDPEKMKYLLYLLAGNRVSGCNYKRIAILHKVFSLQLQLKFWLDNEFISPAGGKKSD